MFKWIAFIGFCSFSAISFSKPITIKNCLVSFETKGEPISVRISGQSDEPCSGSLDIEMGKVVKASFKMPLHRIETGIPLRNRHLRENYLKVEIFPMAQLEINEFSQLNEQLAGNIKTESPFTGSLELVGKSVGLQDSFYRIDDHKAYARFSIHLPRWGIEMPSFMGVKVVDKVMVKVQLELQK